MSSPYPRLRILDEDGRADVSDALLINFYMKVSYRQLSPPAMGCLDILRERIRPYALSKYITSDGDLRTLTEERWEQMRQEVLREEKPKTSLRLADERVDAGGFYVDYRGLTLPSPWPFRAHESSVLFLRLPTEYLEERGPGHVRELALELAGHLPFNSGYVNLILGGNIYPPPRRLVELVQRRYWGIQLVQTGANLHMDTWVDGVQWMNFLGPPVLEKVGGVAGLRERLKHPDISIQEVGEERVVVTLGEAPTAGDVEAGETLPMHRMLARVLEPYLYQDKRRLTLEEIEAFRRWERRFLD
jgi:hypothetical protein